MNRNEPFYSALHTKWAILRKVMQGIGVEIRARPITDVALSQVRQKVGALPFENLLKHGYSKHIDSHDSLTMYKGYRLFAVDGSSLNLPSFKELGDVFGRPSSTPKCRTLPQASFTVLDLVNTGWIVDYKLEKYDASELSQTKELTKILGKGDLLLADRLYFDTAWYKDLCKREVKFLFRVSNNRHKSLTAQSRKSLELMRKEGNVDCLVQLKVKGKRSNSIQVRYLEIKREGMETLYFMTNLTKEEFSTDEIVTLYRMRWEIETEIRFLKGQDHLPVILSRKEVTVRQEMAARILAHNTVRYIQSKACLKMSKSTSEDTDEPSNTQRKYIRKNTKTWQKKSSLWPIPRRPVDLRYNKSVSLILGYFLESLLFPSSPPDKRWDLLLHDIVNAEIMVKDGRSFPRKGRKFNKDKRQKGNLKAQELRRKKRKQNKGVVET